MPLYVGYAEAINAGKTVQNEDQASAKLLVLTQQGADSANGTSSRRESSNGVVSEMDDDAMLTPGTDDSVRNLKNPLFQNPEFSG